MKKTLIVTLMVSSAVHSESELKNFKTDQDIRAKVALFKRGDIKNIYNRDFLTDFTYDNLKKFFRGPKQYKQAFAESQLSFAQILTNAKFDSGSIPPTEEQFNAIKGVMASESPVNVVEGVPGAGKTSGVLKWVVAFTRGQNPNIPIYISAPNEGGMKAATGDFKDEIANNTVTVLKFEELILLRDKRATVIVDECYLMNRTELKVLFEAALKNGWNLLLTGDPLQNIPNPKTSVVGYFSNFPTFTLSQSFRAQTTEDKNFATVVMNAWNAQDTQKESVQKGLSYLYQHDERKERFGDMIKNIEEMQGVFTGIKLYTDPNAHIKAVANWILSYIKEGKTTMLAAHDLDIPSLKEALSAGGASPQDIEKIVKTSAQSQGAAADYVAVLLTSNMTQSEIYVALTRHKKEVVVVVPILNNPRYFTGLEHAVEYPYKSDQISALVRKKWQGAAHQVIDSIREERSSRSSTPASDNGSIGRLSAPNLDAPLEGSFSLTESNASDDSFVKETMLQAKQDTKKRKSNRGRKLSEAEARELFSGASIPSKHVVTENKALDLNDEKDFPALPENPKR